LALDGSPTNTTVLGFQFIVLDHQRHQFGPDPTPEADDDDKLAFSQSLDQFMRAWFHNQSETPLGDILSLRNLALHLNQLASNLGHEIHDLCQCDPSGQVIHHEFGYRATRLSQQQLVDVLRQSTTQIGQQMANQLTLSYDLFIELSRDLHLRDFALGEDFTNSSNGFSFLRGQTTDWSIKRNPLVRHIMDHDPDEWIDQTGIVRRRAYSYLHQIDTFLQDLLVIIHMSSGAPARGSEILQIQVFNTPNARRTLFLDPRTGLFLIRLR
jgi:hypothetical protein